MDQNQMINRVYAKYLQIAIVSFVVLLASQTTYFEVRLPALDRGLISLTLVLFIAYFFKSGPGLLPLPFPLLLLTGAMFFSLIHQYESYILQDLIGYLSFCLSGLLLVHLLEFQKIINGLVFSEAILVFWSICLLISNDRNAWGMYGQFQGPFSHYNSLAGALVLLSPSLFVSFKNQTNLSKVLRLTLILLVAWLILLSTSKTSLIVFITLFFLFIVFMGFNYSKKVGYAAVISLVVVSCFFASNWSLLLKTLGKDNSLTGRTEIWKMVFQYWYNNHYYGVGWARLFPITSDVYNSVSDGFGAPVFHAHNDALQWLISTGWIGLIALFLCFLYLLFAFISSLSDISERSRSLWLLLTIGSFIAMGITELSTFQTEGWMMFSLSLGIAASVPATFLKRLTINFHPSVDTRLYK